MGSRALAPAQTYTYPITVVSNQGVYKGPVRLSLASPAVSGVVARFDPETVTLGTEATSTLTLTLQRKSRTLATRRVRVKAGTRSVTVQMRSRVKTELVRMRITAKDGAQLESVPRYAPIWIGD